jgi:hypothetical protein
MRAKGTRQRMRWNRARSKDDHGTSLSYPKVPRHNADVALEGFAAEQRRSGWMPNDSQVPSQNKKDLLIVETHAMVGAVTADLAQ